MTGCYFELLINFCVILLTSRSSFGFLTEYYSGKRIAGDSVKNSNTKKSSSKEKSSKSKKQLAESDGGCLLMGKDTSLFLFKALGKILYCKRTYS